MHILAQYLEMHQINQVNTMVQLSRYLDGNATQLSEHLRFNQSSLREAVYKMLQQIERAQEFLDAKGPQIVGKVFTLFIYNICSELPSHFYNLFVT